MIPKELEKFGWWKYVTGKIGDESFGKNTASKP